MKILIFGLGEQGKKVIDQVRKYSSEYTIQAIVDNYSPLNDYSGIPVIRPSQIREYVYDEIWICTVYFETVMDQLSVEYNISPEKLQYMEPVLPILERKIRNQIQICDNQELQEVYNYLLQHHLRMYCYPFYDEYLFRDTDIFWDSTAKLFYGIFEGKKVYLSKKFDTVEKAQKYLNSILMEQDERTPHCYWNFLDMLKSEGKGIDVGAAEGIFGLKIIDQIEHLYMIEVEEEWIEALEYTYAPYKEKVTIIKKMIGNCDAGLNAKLDTLFASIQIDFLKMDIEGMEIEALQGASKLLSQERILLAVCTYHHKDDYDNIYELLKSYEFQCESSRGYVVCQGDWELERDEAGFRKALLFAHKGR